MTTSPKNDMVWFGMKLTPEEKAKIKELARRQGTSAKQAVMALVEEAVNQEPVKAPKGSFLEGIEDLVDSVEGVRDLSTNPRHMEHFGI
jgi:hypothetical protein